MSLEHDTIHQLRDLPYSDDVEVRQPNEDEDSRWAISFACAAWRTRLHQAIATT